MIFSGEAIISTTLNVNSGESILRGTAFPESLEKISAIEGRSAFKRKDFEESLLGATAPSFVSPLKGKTSLEEGGAAHFEAMIEPTRDESMVVEWLKDGRPLPAGSRYRPFFDFGYVALDVLKLTAEDSGTYTVKVTNHL